MPGPIISRWLQPPDYDVFYKLAHAYSEELLVHGASIQMAGEILSRTMDRLPEEVVAIDAHLHRFKESIRVLQADSRQLPTTIRACFWPHVARNKGDGWSEARDLDEAFNRERWSPYDSDAWDRFFATVVEQLQPQFAALKQLVQSLNLPDNPIIANHSTPLKDMLAEIQNRINRLESLLDAAQVETLYAPRE